jgi:hypothetical protein
VASGARVLALRLAAGQPGGRVELTRNLGEGEGLRSGDHGTLLWIDDEVHIEMDSGHLVSVDDPDAIRRLDVPSLDLPAARSA